MKTGKQSSPILLLFLVTSILFLVWLIWDSDLLGPPATSGTQETVQVITEKAPSPTELPPMGWLETINNLRAQSGLAAVAENEKWSEACELHSRYMVKNNTIEHDEDPDNPWYTPEGAGAAKNSNVMVSSDPRSPDGDAIALWVSEPFHGIGILDPQLEIVGFGSYREASGKWKMAAALDVASGNTYTEPPESIYPVIWPPDGQATMVLSYDGTEWPNPLTSCPGYKAPSGPPIYLQIGNGRLTPNVTASSFQKGSENIEYCIFDETNYSHHGTNGEQEIGRNSLDTRDAIILIPRQPLKPGATYTVTITVNEQTYTWSFTAKR